MKITYELIQKNSSQRIRRGEALEDFVKRLSHIRLDGKKIALIENLDVCEALQVLYLYDNNIASMQGIPNLGTLTHLYLQNNQISEISGLDSLPRLQKLFLSDNRISSLAGLEGCTGLEELHVAKQKMAKGASLVLDRSSLAAVSNTLTFLDVSSNGISDPSPLEVLETIERVHIRESPIEDFGVVAAMFRGGDPSRSLWQLDMRGCPITRVRRYRDRVILGGPSLGELDNKDVSPTERKFLENFYARRQRAVGAVAQPSQVFGAPPSAGLGLEAAGQNIAEQLAPEEAIGGVPRMGPGIDQIARKRRVDDIEPAEREDVVPAPGVDRQAEATRLAAHMQLSGLDPEEVEASLKPKSRESAAAQPEPQDEFQRIVGEIEERKQFLEDMRALGKAGEHEALIKAQISDKVRELEQIDRSRTEQAVSDLAPPA